MNHGSLFSGIGGFDLAAEWMGWNNIFHCEWNEFGQKVLKYYWPKAISYEDITKTDFSIHRGQIDILTGGFPCQPYSAAGKRLGKEDDRHLWPEMLRAIQEIQPTWVVGENVLGLVNWNGGLVFEEVQTDLEAVGYEVQPFILPACAKNAPHRRDRVWFVGHRKVTTNPMCDGQQRDKGDKKGFKHTTGREALSKPNSHVSSKDATPAKGGNSRGKPTVLGVLEGTDGRRYTQRKPSHKIVQRNNWQNFPTQPPVCSRDDGLPPPLHGITFPKWRNESIKAYGNSIVPQVVYEIFKAIEETNKHY